MRANQEFARREFPREGFFQKGFDVSLSPVVCQLFRSGRSMGPIVFLLVSLIASLFSLLSTPVGAQESSLSMKPVGDGYYQLTYLPLEKTIPSGGILSIQISNDPAVFGELEIICDSSSAVVVDVQLAYQADDRGDAKEMQRLIQLSFDTDREDLTLTLDFDDELRSAFEDNGPRAEIQITVPIGARLEIEAPYMRLTSSGPIGALIVQDSYEPVEISGAEGHLVISAVNTRVAVENLTGSFDINNSNGRIILTDITVTDLQSASSRSASARTENADIVLTRYAGPLNLRVTRGNIRGRSVSLTGRQSSLRNSGGIIDMRFESVEGSVRLQVRNSYEDVRLRFREDISATFNLTARDDGSIDLRDIPHRVDKVTDRKFEAIAGDGLAQIRVTTKFGGDILVEAHR